jgi:hypothetical protein
MLNVSIYSVGFQGQQEMEGIDPNKMIVKH